MNPFTTTMPPSRLSSFSFGAATDGVDFTAEIFRQIRAPFLLAGLVHADQFPVAAQRENEIAVHGGPGAGALVPVVPFPAEHRTQLGGPLALALFYVHGVD